MEPVTATLIAVVCATAGWMFSARRARILSRKQHTINMLLQASFHQTVLEANKAIAPHLKAGKMPDLSNGQDETLRAHFRMMLNHHEFVAAALRNGDFDERLLRDSERSAVTSLFKCCEEYIWNLRSSRDRVAIYEHLEWLYTRWETSPPGPVQRTLERMKGTPFYGSRNPQKRK